VTDQSPYEKLGVSPDASFEEIQSARKRLTDKYSGDRLSVETIEAAYDAVLMERLRLRQEGKIKVPEGIRFPEKLKKAPSAAPSSTNKPLWLEQLIDTPSQADILLPMGVFGLLMIFSASTGSAEQTGGLQLALAVGFLAAVYFLNRKERKLGRSVLLTLGGLFVGLLVGGLLYTGLESLAIIDRGFSNQFAAGVTFFVLWLVSSFLR
jgi:hypothetical protein